MELETVDHEVLSLAVWSDFQRRVCGIVVVVGADGSGHQKRQVELRVICSDWESHLHAVDVSTGDQRHFFHVAGNDLRKPIGVCFVPELLVRSKQVESPWEDVHSQDEVAVSLEFVFEPGKLCFTSFSATLVFDGIVQRIERDEGQIFPWEVEAVIASVQKSVFGNILFNSIAFEINIVEGAVVLIGLLFIARDIIINDHVIVSYAG